MLVISSKVDKNTLPVPVVVVDVPPGKKHLEAKVTKAWIHIHKHYLEDFDFFYRCDTDVYVVVENLLDYLKDQDPAQAHYFGHRFDSFTSGGPGMLLSREALRRMVTHEKFPRCMKEKWKSEYMCVFQ